MPIQDGKYVNPGFVNATAPALNASEMNAIADTLAALSTGTFDVEQIVIDEEVTIYKFGKLVLLSYRAKTKYSSGSTQIPAKYAPSMNNFHMIAPIYASVGAGGQAPIEGYACVFVQTTGVISVEVWGTDQNVCPRFDAMYFGK